MFSLYTESIHESSHPTFNLAFQALIFSSAASSASIASRRAFSSSIQHHLRSPKEPIWKEKRWKTPWKHMNRLWKSNEKPWKCHVFFMIFIVFRCFSPIFESPEALPAVLLTHRLDVRLTASILIHLGQYEAFHMPCEGHFAMILSLAALIFDANRCKKPPISRQNGLFEAASQASLYFSPLAKIVSELPSLPVMATFSVSRSSSSVYS